MLTCIFSLVVGGLLGAIIHLDAMIIDVSEWMKSIAGSSDDNFSDGLITAFLLFCVGSMSIIGSIEEGLQGKRELLIVKSTLDGFSSIALAATLGVGVIFSIIPMLIFQGSLTISAKWLRNIFDDKTTDLLSSVGGLLILAIAFNLLSLGDINLENLLPALVVAVLLSKAQISYNNGK